MNQVPTKPGGVDTGRPWHQRRSARVLIVIGLTLAILGLAISYAPRYVVRHLLGAELTELGIDYEGVDTLRINPWTLEAWIGPVRFSQGEAPQGQLAELGVEIAPGELFSRNALIQRLIVRGLQIHISRARDGSFALNGIPLARFMEGSGPETPAEEDAVWGAGVDNFELRESRLVYADQSRGELVAKIDRLTLDGFRTWSPDQAGDFALDARVNDIVTQVAGQARPFADNITLTAHSGIEGANLPSIIEFTGSLGLDRREGLYNTRLEHDITLFDTGRLEGQARGTIEVLDADYTRGEDFVLTLDRSEITLDTLYSLSAQGDLTIAGRIEIDADTAGSTLANEMRVSLSSGRAVFDRIDAAFGADRSIRIDAAPDIEITDGSFSGRLQISVNQILDLLAYLQSLSAVEGSTAETTGLEDWSEGEVILPTSDVRVARLNTSVSRFELLTDQGAVSLDLTAETEASGVGIESGDRHIDVKAISSALERLSLRSGGGELHLELAGTNALTGGTSNGPIGKLEAGSLQAAIDRFAMASRSGQLELEISATSDAERISGTVYEEEHLPETGFEVGSVNASLSSGEATISPRSLEWRASGAAKLADTSVAVAKGEKARIALKRLEITEASADQSLAAEGGELTIAGLDTFLTRSFLEGLKQTPGDHTGQETSAPPQGRELIREIQRLLAELGFEPGPADGAMGNRTRTAIQAFQEQQGLRVNTQVSQTLLADLRAVAAGDPPPSRPAMVELPKLKLDRFALEGAKVSFLDDMVDPRVKIDTRFEKTEILDLDTTDPSVRTRVEVAATVNEFTRVEVNGWASELGTAPTLEATARIENLQLPSFSPYAVQLAGMYLESGQLTTTTSATAEQGKLDGLIELDMLDIELEPLSATDAERLAGQTGGLPIKTVVALLQDSQGRIELGLPLKGAVAEPEVDLSSAINKAIAGAFKSVFRAFGGKGRGGLDFEPIVFAAGSAELTGQGRGDAGDVVTLLEERPKLSLDVCGRATAADLEALRQAQADQATASEKTSPPKATGEQAAPAPGDQPATMEALSARLTELAVERTRSLRRYLVTERGVDAGRLAECRAVFDAEDEGPPRAEVKF
jgi:peptidoglycan hydrolase-like protein with peptidoglycan-binding domain